MTRLMFGVDDPPVIKETMAYIGRHADCGHVRIIVVDHGRVAALQDLAELYASGLVLERITVEEARQAFGECDVCQPPDQIGIGL